MKGGSSRAPTIPSYIAVPALLVPSSVLFGYWYFRDEAPFTGRARILATSPQWERQLGDQQYQSLLKIHQKNILPATHRASVTVQRVGSRVAKAADNFLLDQQKQRRAQKSLLHNSGFTKNSNYTYTIIKSDMANAFVLPNNHVFVLTGLLKYIKNEDELAAVLGHEMGHVIARHAGERISSSILISVIARFTLLLDPSGVIYSIFMPTATLLHELPHSRDHEIEADYIGLQLATDACYDPRAVKKVFSAMKQDNEGDKESYQRPPSEFISTHPSYDTRISNFDKWMPGALNKFHQNGNCRMIRQEMKKARQVAAAKASQREQRLGRSSIFTSK